MSKRTKFGFNEQHTKPAAANLSRWPLSWLGAHHELSIFRSKEAQTGRNAIFNVLSCLYLFINVHHYTGKAADTWVLISKSVWHSTIYCQVESISHRPSGGGAFSTCIHEDQQFQEAIVERPQMRTRRNGASSQRQEAFQTCTSAFSTSTHTVELFYINAYFLHFKTIPILHVLLKNILFCYFFAYFCIFYLNSYFLHFLLVYLCASFPHIVPQVSFPHIVPQVSKGFPYSSL